MDKKLLINFAHPRFEQSKTNKAMIAAIESLDGITINDLYQEYPDYLINIEREQQLLLEHDIVVFQHPFYWYSSPSLLKEWQDLVLANGFAFGEGGYQLQGKKWINAITLGGNFESYSAEGYNQLPIEQLLTPLQQTANFCGMTYLDPFVVYDVLRKTSDDILNDGEKYRHFLLELQGHQLEPLKEGN